MKKTNLGPVAVKIDRESVNALLQSLNQIAAIDPENHIAQSAQKLMQKIIKHGRTFPHDDMKLVSIYFYDNEASMLIQLVSMYLSAVQENTEDYYDRIGRSRKRGLGNPQSAEQTISDKTEN
jgi:hypothetical protein